MTSYIERFDLSSEEVLGVSGQPHDTCDYNHPIHHELEHILTGMQRSLSGQQGNVREFDVDLDCLGTVELIEAVDGFTEWFGGWYEVFERYIENTLSEDIAPIYRDKISTIENLLKHEHYSAHQISAILDNIPNMITCFERCVAECLSKKYEIHHECEILESTITTLERNLTYCDSDDENYLEGELKNCQYQLELLEDASDKVFSEAIAIMNEFESIVELFGNPMQRHYSMLRKEIKAFKTIIKKDLMIMNRPGEKFPILTYPSDHLKQQIAGHIREPITVIAACEETFIRRVILMEKAREQLSDNERHQLINNKNIQIAVKRFQQDYPEFEQILWFASKQEALVLGRREFISISTLLNQRTTTRKDDTIVNQNEVRLQIAV